MNRNLIISPCYFPANFLLFTFQESRSAAIRQRLGRVAQNKVFRFALAASIAVIIFTTTGKA